MPPFINSYVFKSIAWLADQLWSDPIGRIFLITFISYFLGYSVYGGYLSRFTGGFAGFSLSRLGFQISDLITLFPIALFTIISITIRTFKSFVKWFIIVLLFQIFVLVFGLIIGSNLKNNNIYVSGIVAQIFLLIFILSFFISIITIYPIRKHIKFTILIGSIQIISIALSFSGINNISQPPPLSTVLNISALKIIEIMTEETIASFIVLSILFLPTIFGMHMGNASLQGRALSKVKSLTLHYPLPQLASFLCPESMRTRGSLHITSLPWYCRSSIPVSVEPDVFIYQFSQNTPVYLIDIFTNSTGLYILDSPNNAMQGRLVIVKQDLIQSIELHSTKDSS